MRCHLDRIDARSPGGSPRRGVPYTVVGALCSAVVVALALCAFPEEGELAVAQPPPVQLDLLTLSANFNNPIGIDYHAPTDALVMSVNYPSGEPYNFELIDQSGRRRRFSDVEGLTDELKIGSVRPGSCQGGFRAGTVFSGTGRPGEILRIAPDGSSADAPWVRLAGETGLMRGGFDQDRHCVLDGDLVVVTTSGGVWRVSERGEARQIVDLEQWLEGVAVIPDEVALYGPWAGRILTGNEKTGDIYAITASGEVTAWRLGIEPEDFDIVNPGEVFYGVDFGAKRLVAADAAQLERMENDLLIADERGPLWWVRWNPLREAFDSQMVARVAQWEHVTVAPPSILEVPTPTATTFPTPSSSPTPTARPTRTVTPPPTSSPDRIWLPVTLSESTRVDRKPVRVVLVLDVSTSMLRTTGRGSTKITEALRAARGFIAQLRADRGDLIGVVAFNDRAWIHFPVGRPERAAAALDRVVDRVAHGTRLDRALQVARTAAIRGAADGTEPAIILLTDGLPNRVPTPAAGGSQEDTVVEAAQVIRSEGVRLIAIGLGAPDDILSRLLVRVATAGDFHAAPDVGDLQAIYDRILRDLVCGSAATWGRRCRP